jgi:hypothetical protein
MLPAAGIINNNIEEHLASYFALVENNHPSRHAHQSVGANEEQN